MQHIMLFMIQKIIYLSCLILILTNLKSLLIDSIEHLFCTTFQVFQLIIIYIT